MKKTALLVTSIVLISGVALSACNKPSSSQTPTTIEISNTQTAPTVTLEITKDDVGGWNLYAQTENFKFSPEKVGQNHVDGEGYLQILVNGEPTARMYQPWYHLNLEDGDQVTVVPTSNDGKQFNLNGEAITATAVAESKAMDDSMEMEGDHSQMAMTDKEKHTAHGHDHDKPFIVTDPDLVPSVKLTITPDPDSGWNAYLVTENFTFTPEKVNHEETEIGEGHAHIYVDGEKISRVYGEWFHINSLEPGTRQIKVNLNANGHNPYNYDGLEVADTVTVTVE